MVERSGRKIAVFRFRKNDLVMLTGVARQKNHLAPARWTPVGDQEAKSTTVKTLPSYPRKIADLDLEMAQRDWHAWFLRDSVKRRPLDQDHFEPGSPNGSQSVPSDSSTKKRPATIPIRLRPRDGCSYLHKAGPAE